MTGSSGGMACVLFTDLVGSTEMMSRLGDVPFDELRSEHFALMRAATAAHHGVEVKNTGDGIMVSFASAVEATACAVAMQQAADRQSRTAGVPIAIRVGLSLGEATFDGGDVFGTPVVEAARLVAAAQPGQILAAAVVRVVVGSRAPAGFTDLGLVDLKGLPEPLAVCEIAWAPLPATTTVPLPPLLGGSARLFVGRGEELERLGQLWKEAGAGGRSLALVGGEPGIGKTRLATEFALGVTTGPALVLAGRCDEDLGVPYQPFVEAMRHYVTHVTHPRLGGHPGELARLVPELSEQVPDLPAPIRSDPETERYRLFDAVAAWLADVSSETPVLLVLDDLQWAAKPTLLLLRHVLRSPEPLRLLVVATYRDTDIGRGDPLTEFLADVRRIEGVERFPLTGLDVPGVAALLERLGGQELDEEGEFLAQALWRETEGNPFFVVEVLRHLSESGAIEQRDGRWVAAGPVEEIGIPEGVRDVIGRRLSRLSEVANRVLACASVVGLEFEPAVVQAAGGFAEDAVLSALEEAIATRLVVEVPAAVPRGRFAHALVRATLHDELTAARRVALHRRVAEAIETVHAGALDDHLSALAHHWARASAPAAETARAVDYATRAGDRALAQLAHDEAVTYYRQALELLDAASGSPSDDSRRVNLLLALGEAQRRAGDAGFRDTFLGVARFAQERGDADVLVRAALANNRGAWGATFQIDAEQVTVLEAALDAVGATDGGRRARLLATLGAELTFAGDRHRRVAASDEALAIARRLGDSPTLAQVLLARCATNFGDPALVADSLATTAELSELTVALADPFTRAWVNYWRYAATFQAGLIDDADAALEALDQAAAEGAQPQMRWVSAIGRGGRLLAASRHAEGEAMARQALDLGMLSGQPDARVFFGAQRYQIRYEQGRLDEVLPRVEENLAVTGRPLARAMLAFTYCELGREADARHVFEPLVSAVAELPADPVWIMTIALCAAACAHLQDAKTAEVLYELLHPHQDQVAGSPVTWHGSVAYFLGLLATTLGHLDEAHDRFARAAATDERCGAPGWLARTRLEWAHMLLHRADRGDADRARQLLGQAVAVAVELGLGMVERRARALLEELQPEQDLAT